MLIPQPAWAFSSPIPVSRKTPLPGSSTRSSSVPPAASTNRRSVEIEIGLALDLEHCELLDAEALRDLFLRARVKQAQRLQGNS